MASDEFNPYASPETDANAPLPDGFAEPTRKKIEAIIKDAGQFWLAILICIVCSGIGSLIIGPWYLVRLLQWNSMAKAHPQLLDPFAPPRSLSKKFQSAKAKLIIGMSVGALMLVAVAFYIVLTVFAPPGAR